MLKFNGKDLKLVLNYNTMCELEEMGLSITEIDKTPMRILRAVIYVSLKKEEPKITLEKVGEYITSFLGEGGTIEDISKEFEGAIEESGFFPKNNK